MLTLKEIAEAKMALAEGVLLPSVWTARAFDAAEAWAKLVAMLDVGYVHMKRPGYAPHEVICELNWDYGWAVVRKETPEAAVAALFDKIGGTDAKCD